MQATAAGDEHMSLHPSAVLDSRYIERALRAAAGRQVLRGRLRKPVLSPTLLCWRLWMSRAKLFCGCIPFLVTGAGIEASSLSFDYQYCSSISSTFYTKTKFLSTKDMMSFSYGFPMKGLRKPTQCGEILPSARETHYLSTINSLSGIYSESYLLGAIAPTTTGV
ncbi:hypothetical protein C8F04DRAFT_1231909 [Mycena alexandri]|uniref:Uncharacterized protein n=1 Tax=Mycena alexandri TaxID=1745969 RepID=A0AAD6X4K8_9AGAR|nr:hypothetical protein C8F04DRAFT_1231909 [Mycena alexandri]